MDFSWHQFKPKLQPKTHCHAQKDLATINFQKELYAHTLYVYHFLDRRHSNNTIYRQLYIPYSALL